MSAFRHDIMPAGAVAVIFVAQRTTVDEGGYAEAAAAMDAAAAAFPGYLGMRNTRGADGLGITISYWESDAAARAWKADAAHTLVREKGRAGWYEHYELIVAEVTRSYGWETPERHGPVIKSR